MHNKMMLMVPLLTAFGCAHAVTAKSPQPVAAGATTPSTAGQSATASAPGTCASDLECGSGQLCIRSRCENISAGLAECAQLRVHFPFNSDELSSGDRSNLERGARCLKADSALHVTVEGNADERGTEEYNIALGDRRATAVASYLEALGASKAQLKTVSYGKENPLCTEHDEACWAQNRRADLALAGKHSNKR